MPKQNIVISNTTPIIALCLVQQLTLLQKLYDEVWIPPAVEMELLAGGTRIGAIEIQAADYIRTIELHDPRRADLLSDLDRGEAEVIALAQERDAALVIIDERLGRRHARRLGLTLTGVVGVLLKAKQRGFLDVVKPHLEKMQNDGIHLSQGLVSHALQIANE